MNFIEEYIRYTEDTETSVFYYRWAAFAGLAAWLERQFLFQHGPWKIHPNIYVLFIGSVGARKSVAIKSIASLLKEAGYTTFAANKTRQEKFLLDLAANAEDEDGESFLDTQLFKGGTGTETSPCFIAADEFNNFIGVGNVDFASLLGELWDYDGVYEYRLKNSNSVTIPYPTITLLGGNTHTNFVRVFPTDILGQGFFSRLLLIYGERTSKQITFPRTPSEKDRAKLVRLLHKIKSVATGEMTLTAEARSMLDTIYKKHPPLKDSRFEGYSDRRFTHLLKLCLISTAATCSSVCSLEHVIYANTVLSYTEHLMPKALGEFGKSKHSDVNHKIIVYLREATSPISIRELWEAVSNDLDRVSDLATLLENLLEAGKLQNIRNSKTGAGGFLLKQEALSQLTTSAIDYSLLTQEEQDNVF